MYHRDRAESRSSVPESRSSVSELGPGPTVAPPSPLRPPTGAPARVLHHALAGVDVNDGVMSHAAMGGSPPSDSALRGGKDAPRTVTRASQPTSRELVLPSTSTNRREPRGGDLDTQPPPRDGDDLDNIWEHPSDLGHAKKRMVSCRWICSEARKFVKKNCTSQPPSLTLTRSIKKLRHWPFELRAAAILAACAAHSDGTVAVPHRQLPAILHCM